MILQTMLRHKKKWSANYLLHTIAKTQTASYLLVGVISAIPQYSLCCYFVTSIVARTGNVSNRQGLGTVVSVLLPA